MDKEKNKKAEKKRLYTIAVSKEIHELLKKQAEKDRRTVGVTTEILLEEGMELRK